MSVHLVETSEEDSYLAVTRHVADLLNEGEVSRRLVQPDRQACLDHANLFAAVIACITANMSRHFECSWLSRSTKPAYLSSSPM